MTDESKDPVGQQDKSILQRLREGDPMVPEPPAFGRQMLEQMEQEAESGEAVEIKGSRVNPATKADIDRLEEKLDAILAKLSEQ